MSQNLSRLIATALAGRAPVPDVIADVLRSIILRGHFEGGQPLRQDDLAERFGISRMPVREALRQLAAEGLVDFHARRGAFVAHLQPIEAHEILEIRHTLEAKAVALAMPNWTEATFTALTKHLDESEACASIDLWSDLNIRFHEGLYSPCGRPRLIALIGSLNANVDRYIRLLVSRSDYRQQAEREHRAILAASRVRNLPALAALIEQHAMDTAAQLQRFLNQHERPDTRKAARSAKASKV